MCVFSFYARILGFRTFQENVHVKEHKSVNMWPFWTRSATQLVWFIGAFQKAPKGQLLWKQTLLSPWNIIYKAWRKRPMCLEPLQGCKSLENWECSSVHSMVNRQSLTKPLWKLTELVPKRVLVFYALGPKTACFPQMRTISKLVHEQRYIYIYII